MGQFAGSSETSLISWLGNSHKATSPLSGHFLEPQSSPAELFLTFQAALLEKMKDNPLFLHMATLIPWKHSHILWPSKTQKHRWHQDKSSRPTTAPQQVSQEWVRPSSLACSQIQRKPIKLSDFPLTPLPTLDKRRNTDQFLPFRGNQDSQHTSSALQISFNKLQTFPSNSSIFLLNSGVEEGARGVHLRI